MFVDVQATLLFYSVLAWEDDFTGYLVDYGTYPDQKRPYFTLRDARATLAIATKAGGLEGCIYAGLERLTSDSHPPIASSTIQRQVKPAFSLAKSRRRHTKSRTSFTASIPNEARAKRILARSEWTIELVGMNTSRNGFVSNTKGTHVKRQSHGGASVLPIRCLTASNEPSRLSKEADSQTRWQSRYAVSLAIHTSGSTAGDTEQLIFRIAGVMGIDPMPFTLRELVWMARGKREHDWSLASHVMALLAEINRDRKKRRRPFRAEEFNPMVSVRPKPVPCSASQLAKILSANHLRHRCPCGKLPAAGSDNPTLEPEFAVAESKLTVRRDGGKVVVSVPVRFYRRNGRQMILTVEEVGKNGQPKSPTANTALVTNLAKAWLWQDQLESGEFGSVEEIAAANKVDRTHISRILQLTSLSPTIVEQILCGNEHEGLSLRRLRKGIPVVWNEQKCFEVFTN
jgi:hypothetical protein